MLPRKTVLLGLAITTAMAPLAVIPESIPGKRALPKCSRGMTLQDNADGLHMKSVKPDPHLTFARLPKGILGPLEVEVEVSSGMGKYGAFFWSGPGQTFTGQRRVKYDVRDSGRQTYRVPILGVKELTALRFDPGPNAGEATLHRLTLILPFSDPVQLWPPRP